MSSDPSNAAQAYVDAAAAQPARPWVPTHPGAATMAGPGFDMAQEVEFVSGIDSTGHVSATAYWTYNGDTPATYNATTSEAHKFGGATAGTGGTITYFFDAASNWTPLEQASWVASMHVWTAVANVTFAAAGSAGAASIVIVRDPNEAAGFATVTGVSTIGGTTIDTTGTGQVVVGPDAVLPPNGDPQALGGYAYGVMQHEIGHVLGLGHGGVYNGAANPATQQIGIYDTLAYTAMSYIAPDDATAAYYGDYPVNFNWGSSADGYPNQPTTPMMLDILAAQRLYGLPTNSQFNGGETFGFNTTITGDIKRFYDFTADAAPIVTLYDFGTGNTLDLSGYSEGSVVNLAPGTFSSAHGMTNNIAIAFGTVIETGIGGTGNDSFTGTGVANRLFGGGGNDTLNGGTGADRMDGGTGNDTFYVDNTSDQVNENAGAGTDTVFSTIGYRLGANLEILRLQGAASVVGNGNELANAIYGNSGNNLLQGFAANDTIEGGDGKDRLDGGLGVDQLRGGLADDTYYIDSTSDFASEDTAGTPGGVDTVYSSVSYRLLANFEILRLLGGDALTGNGNELRNTIEGNTGANLLQGFAGNDAITGMGGMDRLFGGDGDDALNGGADADQIEGGTGNDTLTGGSAADIFRFATSNAGTDRITDFSTTLDHFDLLGGVFTSSSISGANTVLRHTGGTIIVEGVTGLSLAQWNGLTAEPFHPEAAPVQPELASHWSGLPAYDSHFGMHTSAHFDYP